MDAVTVVDWTWLGGCLAVVAIALLAVTVTRRRRQWPDRLTFMGGRAPTTSPVPVHVLGPDESPHAREHQPTPRIDPDRRYVFGEYEPELSGPSTRASRHDSQWALRQSTRRRRMARGSIAVLLAAAIALTILVLVGSSVHHKPPSGPTHHAVSVGAPPTYRDA